MSNKLEDGGPAFPNADEGQGWGSCGMSLRDWFAGQALIGMMRAMTPYSDDFARNARDAFRQADAMLSAQKGGAV